MKSNAAKKSKKKETPCNREGKYAFFQNNVSERFSMISLNWSNKAKKKLALYFLNTQNLLVSAA